MSYNPNFAASFSKVIGDRLSNNSGISINRITPVRVDSNGDIRTINVSIEDEAKAIVGLSSDEISSSAQGTIVNSGVLQNIATTANFGDVLYVSKTGGLTNVIPEIGIGGFVVGDFVIKVGVIFKNEQTPLQQDLMLDIDIIGQL